MPIEIERKFLVTNDTWKTCVSGQTAIIQGYLANTDKCSVRVRIAGDQAQINLKSMTPGILRFEYEYSIPVNEAREILRDLCLQPFISKTRYYVRHGPCTWEVDVFNDANDGLVLAELELKDTAQKFDLPDWAGQDVSDDPRYYNINLVANPFIKWDRS